MSTRATSLKPEIDSLNTILDFLILRLGEGISWFRKLMLFADENHLIEKVNNLFDIIENDMEKEGEELDDDFIETLYKELSSLRPKLLKALESHGRSKFEKLVKRLDDVLESLSDTISARESLKEGASGGVMDWENVKEELEIHD